jgi:hypothetical protein
MGRPCQNVGTYKDGPAKIRRLPFDGESYELAYNPNLQPKKGEFTRASQAEARPIHNSVTPQSGVDIHTMTYACLRDMHAFHFIFSKR